MSNSESAAAIVYPNADFSLFKASYSKAVEGFLVNNKAIENLKAGNLKVPDYHAILLSIFHQVYMSSSSFALAGAMVDSRNTTIREYLFHHAEEEMLHWNWILDDLKSTGYKGKDPRSLFPKPTTQAYLSYAMYLANKFPLGRLGMAMVLEGISGKFGSEYGKLLVTSVGLKKENVTFFLSHGELDQGHTEDIENVLKNLDVSSYDWAQLCHVTHCTSELYKAIYNSYQDSLFDIEKFK